MKEVNRCLNMRSSIFENVEIYIIGLKLSTMLVGPDL